ncbi:hypothetical protein IJS77_00600 [bacterium]|nr:hypothetical protein [bacterium]
MTVKIKDSSILTIDLNEETKSYSAKKKTALNLGDYSGYTLSTVNGKTITLKKDEKEIVITDTSKIKYIYSNEKKEYSDIIANGVLN